MFKLIAVFALVAVTAAAPGFVTETHHSLVQPAVLAKTAVVDTSASSAITHQSFTNLEKKVPVVHTYSTAPVVKTVATPVVHAYEAASVVNTVAAAPLHPVVNTVGDAAVIHTYATSPVAHSYAASSLVHSLPVVHSVPVVKTVVPAPVAYHSYH